jgi:hypothetical protein
VILDPAPKPWVVLLVMRLLDYPQLAAVLDTSALHWGAVAAHGGIVQRHHAEVEDAAPCPLTGSVVLSFTVLLISVSVLLMSLAIPPAVSPPAL